MESSVDTTPTACLHLYQREVWVLDHSENECKNCGAVVR